jgi:glycosyltransferase involved in cell wall biosynthesis
LNACTIIAKNYIAQARVLARSFLAHHPDGRFYTLIIDETAGFVVPSEEPFELLTPADIGCDEFLEMAARYSILELSTAVKPWLLRHLLDRFDEPITYLDPDIEVFSSLQRLDDLAQAHGLALTPHNTEPLPDDGHRPSQVDIMIAGVYNLGYVSMAPGPQADRLLRWWSERLLRDCRVDPVWGYFVDQRWFDLAPGFADDYAIVRDPEFNVAYWNLHSREVAAVDGGYTVDGRPLAFFHYSGFYPNRPEQASSHQDRIRIDENPALRQVFAHYAKALLDAGYEETRGWAYTYGRLADGTVFDDRLRRLYIAADEAGRAPGEPFSAPGTDRFFAWLAEVPEEGAPGLNRLLAAVYGDREDLRRRFPDVAGSDRERFLDWARTHGIDEVPGLARVIEEGAPGTAVAPSPEPASEPGPRPPLWGANVVGYFRSELGVGEAARRVVQGLDAHELPLLPIHGRTIPPNRQGSRFTHFATDDARFGVNVICMNADALPEFASQAGPEFFAGRYTAGLWFWEVSSFPPQFMTSFDLVDEVWAASQHVADAIEAVSPVPVVRVRLPVQVPLVLPRSRAELGVPEGFCFLFAFDHHSVFERKNPLAVIRAFRGAFPEPGPARLLIRTINAESHPEDHQRLLDEAAGDPAIRIADGYLSPAEKDTLTALCDCYVSLHRSEGFGFTMAEAMYLGKPVIATGYSGNLDFMDAENSLLVEHELVPIGEGAAPYPATGVWAEPDVGHAAACMRRVFDDRTFAAELGRRAAQSIQQTHGPYQAGTTMATRILELRGHPKFADAATSGRLSPLRSGGLERAVRRGPVPAPGQERGLRGALRRALLRVLRPYTAYQDGINEDVLRALRSLADDADTALQGATAALREARANERLAGLPEVLETHGRQLAALKHDVQHGLYARRFETDRAALMARASLAERYAADGLAGHELRLSSQNGEDGVLAEIFRRIGVTERFFVEFGIESGREGNAVYLADVAGWRGLFIEADDDHYEALQQKYEGSESVRTLRSMVTPENVERLFAEAGVPEEPDLLSIDVDGADYWIWAAIEAYRPRVAIVEYNSVLDPGRPLVQPAERGEGWDGTDYYGASLAALRRLATEKGYRLVHVESSAVNAFFVRADLADGRFPEESEVVVPRGPNFFQGDYRHPAGATGPYLDLDSGELTDR